MQACPTMLHAHPEALALARLEGVAVPAIAAGSAAAQWFSVPGVAVGDFVALSVVPGTSQWQGLVPGIPMVWEPGVIFVALHNLGQVASDAMSITVLIFWLRATYQRPRVEG